MKGLYDLDQKVEFAGIDNCYISEITLAELKYGVREYWIALKDIFQELLLRYILLRQNTQQPVSGIWRIGAGPAILSPGSI